MNTRILEKARTLLLVAVMVTAALTPMLAGANDEQLRETESVMYTVVSTSGDVYLDEGGMGWYEICLDEVPDGVVVITPTSDNPAVEIYPAYLKFSKLNWDECEYFDVEVSEDDDASDTMATISHAIDGTDTIFASSTIADVMVEAYDMDYDMDGDDVPDYDDTDIDGDGVDNDDDAFPEDDTESLDTDGDGIGNNEDLDDDGDGYSDSDESTDCGDASDDLDDTDMPLDTDGDGICDELDSDDDDDMVNDTDDFAPLDESEQYDTDEDGVGDNADVFPNDATETEDSDEDGVGDNSDFDNADADESVDSDGDGVGDNGDAFPDDSTETMDTDGDGVGDNADFAPEDASESADNDTDGVGNNADAFPDDSTETMDTDGDGVGDNADTDADDDTVLDVDEDSNATLDCQLLTDCDGDGVGDAEDAFDVDPEAWDDMDMDGLADSFPNLLVVTEIGCSVSVGYSDIDSDGDGYEDTECTFTLPAGGNMDLYVQTGNYGSETGVKLTLPDSTQIVWAHGYSTGFSSYTLYNLGAYDEPGDYTLHMYDSYGDSCNAGVDGCFVLADAGTVMAMPSSSGFGTDIDMDDDGDTWDDTVEDLCGTDNMDVADFPLDTDSDLECDVMDDDDDGDGVLDSEEADGAGIGTDGADVDCTLVVDCDGDGVDDGTDSNDNDATETTDMDGDGIGDNSDSDVDGDGYGNANDVFPEDGTEWSDNDGDGVGDNSDLDDDDDGTEDEIDDFPFDANQQFDVDGDGWGNNADMDDDGDGIEDQVDEDDDGDGYSDVDEDTNCVGGNSLTDDVTPNDFDGDMSCDSLDADDDDDGTDDVNDAFPMDACADTDTDGDGSPDSLAADCETTLSEDEDDDFDPSNVQVTWTISGYDSYADGFGYVIVYDSDFVELDYCYVGGYECSISLTYGDIVVVVDTDYYYNEAYVDVAVNGVHVIHDLGGGPTSSSAQVIGILVAGDYGGDTWSDADEEACGTDATDYSDEPLDTDGDGICDVVDDDDDNDMVNDTDEADGSGLTTATDCTLVVDCDGDGTEDGSDWAPLDNTEDTDTDDDGVGDNADTDDDGDGWTDSQESTDCGESNGPLDADDMPTDTDSDGECDLLDTDDDDDTILDVDESIGCTLLADCDADGVDDVDESDGSGLTVATDCTVTADCDGDGVGDADEADGSTFDTPVDCTVTVDCDGDTYEDLVDAFPLDDSEWSDMDGDGFGDNDDDGDIDGDGLANAYDACPLDANEYYDTDGDGICDNADDDDDGDGVLDVDDVSPMDPDESTDWDGDGIGDNTDADDDGDGIDDDVDLDEDGESQAYDFDNDGWDDDDEVTCETNGTNSESIPSDNDDDGLCDDFQDDDDDNDGTVDTEDAFPLDTDVYADNDGDGMADSSDVDTNNDYIITTESYSTLTVGVYDYDGNELCMLETDGAYNGAAGDQDSCEINAAGIEIVAIDVDYYTYYGAYFAGFDYSGYGPAVNINVTIGEDEYTYAADYGWVSATSGDSTMSTDEFYATTSAGTVMDEDDDNDGYSDLAETDNCGTASDSMDDASIPLDTDMDMICDELDDDDDDDGYSDADETANCGEASDSLDDMSTPLDTDMDMLCDELDEDDDNDGYSDADETTNCPSDPSDPLNSVDTTSDFDQDGLCDDLDSDDDGDGVDDVDDAFPYDWDATMDTDGDGLADDIDNMATGDWLFEIAYDTDGGNNTFIITASTFNWSLEPNPSDIDANIEYLCMTDTSDSNDSYADCMVDGDTDLVQVELQVIGEPEAYLSTTFPNGFVFESPLGDLIDDEGSATWWFSPVTMWGTALDWDDDNDWFWDVEEEMYCVDDEHGATDSLDDTDMPLDTDMDMLCNAIDVDDDNDGYYDADDAFPVHASSYMDTDGDGMPDFMELVLGDMGDDFELGNFSGMDWNQRDAHPNWGWNDSYGEIFNCEDGQVISWFGQSFVPSYWINDGYVDCNDGSDESVDMDTFGPELTGWERSGDVNFGIGTGSFVDSYGVRGMGLDANESASLSITIETSDGFMMFDYAISSEERYDEMCLFVDGMEYGCMSGQEPKSTYLDENGDWLDFICETPGVYGEQISIDWVQDGWDDCGDSNGDGISDDEDASLSVWTYATGTMEIYVSEGIHTFEWQYSKDGDTDGGSDRVYLDNIRFPTMVEGDLDELIIDMDDDNDGVEDEMDACPLDDTEQIDTDGDGFCNNQDSDDDGDGVYDYNDAMPLDANEQYDSDGDGIGDNTDTDNDNDGCENDVDDLPFDESSCDDFDGDGVGDEADMDDDGDNVLDAEDPFPFDGTAWLDNDGDGMPDFNGPPQFAGDFEGGSISAPWDTYGDADWTVVDSTTSLTGAIINGTFSAQSGDISDSQTSSLVVEFSTIAGDLSFEYVTSTESNWDYLRFYVDGLMQASWSGSTSGVHVQSLTAGTHTFEFQFYKDGSVSSGDDTVWVDDLVLPLAQIANTNNDTDDDNDGTMDDYDLDPLNPCVALDTDGDGLPDSVESGMFDMSGTGDEDYWVDCDASGYYADSDDDGDDWSDEDEMICGSDSLDNNSTPDDFDNDWLCDLLDNDSDNDGIEDSLDSFPYDSTESEDYDGDGIGDNADSDDDNDNVSDIDDAFPYDANESADLDGDGQGDNADNDTDGDGVPNDVDSFPTDDDASTDTDGDGIDDEADTDDDGDGVPDVVDWAPLDSAESVDSDGDGLGDNVDTDDDNDSVEDEIDAFPLDSSEYADYDGDGVGDNADIDDDNDGIPDGVDLFPNDATESRDLDADGLGDNSDSDRDGDGVTNADDIFPNNAAETVDLDMDGIGDNSDVDDDGDGDLDEFDSFPTDSAEWDDTDGDGVGNNADLDDDDDDYSDSVELRCGSDSENANSIPSDYDLDGICDAEDNEISNSDTLDEQEELGWSNAVPGFPAIFAGIALVGAALIGRRNDD